MSDSTQTTDLRGKTLLVSGGSRGIGLAIALRAARDGANVTLLAKTDTPHPKLDGTVHTAAAAIEAAGGNALAVVGDVRDDAAVERAVSRTVEVFGGIDVVVNNASAIDLRPTLAIDMKRYDLMQDVNCRGTFLLSRLAAPYLAWASNPHILTLSPPLNLNPRWAGAHLAYTLSKYGMSLCTLGLAEELRGDGIAVNSLWPRTTIATAAVAHLAGEEGVARARRPEIMADAAHAILTRPAATCSGNFFLDEEALREEGVTDFEPYATSAAEPDLDLFLEPAHAGTRDAA
jgi:citronellol/citronellal dehydrogenase